MVDFCKTYITNQVRKFDVCGKHPNILPVHMTPEKAHAYIANPKKKPGSQVLLDEFPSFETFEDPRPEPSKKDSKWAEILEDTGTPAEFMCKAEALAPGDVATCFTSVSYQHEITRWRRETNQSSDPLVKASVRTNNLPIGNEA